MRYVSINSVPALSTGAVMRQVVEERRSLGDDCWTMWGRGRAATNEHEFNFGTEPEFYLDVLQTRLDGRAGFHSRRATRRLLRKLDEIDPDIVHLHNVHGYYVNAEMLFDWLLAHEKVHVNWTLHDCWAFTGHCAHFTFVNCMQWKEHCALTSACPQLGMYPKTVCRSSCTWNFRQKKAIFTQLPANRMTLVTPSHWLEGLVMDSFLAKYPIEVRYNDIDRSVFKPTPSNFRTRLGIGNRRMVLGVASSWTERKGLPIFRRLSERLDQSEYAVVLIGLSERQIRDCPKQLIALPRTKSQKELAEAYTAADVHLQPSLEETFGMTVAEAAACGTPVIVRRGSACEEAAEHSGAKAITSDSDDIEELVLRIKEAVAL